MVDRGLESEGLAGELNKNEDVDAGRHFEEEKVVNLKWIVEQGKGGEERTGGKSVVGGLRDPVLANLMQLRGLQQFKKIRDTMNPMLCKEEERQVS